ncbi:hypothetical protein EZS27_020993 [termite gut metagenome]|uniref:DUF4271 domain-containing protein n=1 Tax=termite gut metagenome TaxID=433724 RepID=A0A5J4R965_9ZZZZ
MSLRDAIRQHVDTLKHDSISILPQSETDTLVAQHDYEGEFPDTIAEVQNAGKSKQGADTFILFKRNTDAGTSSVETVQLVPVRTQEEIIPVREKGIPIPRTLRTENGVITVLLGCFFLLAFLLSRSKRFLLQQLTDFIMHRERASIFVASGVIDPRYLMLLVLQTCIFIGFCMFYYFKYEFPELTERFSSLSLIGIYVCISLVYLFFKWIIYLFLSRVFFNTVKTRLWMESYATLVYFLGIVLFPFVLLLIYLDLSTVYIIIIGLILLIVIKLLIFYKWTKLFSVNIYSLLLLFLYFCAVEIVPFFFLYEGITQLNNALIK